MSRPRPRELECLGLVSDKMPNVSVSAWKVSCPTLLETEARVSRTTSLVFFVVNFCLNYILSFDCSCCFLQNNVVDFCLPLDEFIQSFGGVRNDISKTEWHQKLQQPPVTLHLTDWQTYQLTSQLTSSTIYRLFSSCTGYFCCRNICSW